MTFKYEGWAYTHPGLERDRNEDCFIMPDSLIIEGNPSQAEQSNIYTGGLFGVFDGMGGLKYGAEASRLAANVFLCNSGKQQTKDTSYDQIKVMTDLFFQSSSEIQEKLGCREAAGTTAATIYLGNENFVVMNVGDSRCYRLSAGKTELLSEDHTLAQLKASLGLYEKNSESYKNDSHLLTQYIGQNNRKHPLKIHIKEGKIHPGDYFFLCTDGVYHLCKHLENTLQQIIKYNMPLSKGAKIIIEEVMKNGACDNLTFILIKVM